MKIDRERLERLTTLLREHRPEPPGPRPDEEARIHSAIRAREMSVERSDSIAIWKWLVPAMACAAAIAVAVVFMRPVPAKNGDLEAYLAQTVGAEYSIEESSLTFPETGSRMLALADAL
jgi:hypothetical protein